MSNFHTIIAIERRTGLRATSIASRASLPDGVDAQGKPKTRQGPEQLHSMGEKVTNPNDPNITMIAQWDGVAPYVTVTKGDYSQINMAFMGWPMETKEQYDAANPAPV